MLVGKFDLTPKEDQSGVELYLILKIPLKTEFGLKRPANIEPKNGDSGFPEKRVSSYGVPPRIIISIHAHKIFRYMS